MLPLRGKHLHSRGGTAQNMKGTLPISLKRQIYSFITSHPLDRILLSGIIAYIFRYTLISYSHLGKVQRKEMNW